MEYQKMHAHKMTAKGVRVKTYCIMTAALILCFFSCLALLSVIAGGGVSLTA
jgi:hypothetical protein